MKALGFRCFKGLGFRLARLGLRRVLGFVRDSAVGGLRSCQGLICVLGFVHSFWGLFVFSGLKVCWFSVFHCFWGLVWGFRAFQGLRFGVPGFSVLLGFRVYRGSRVLGLGGAGLGLGLWGLEPRSGDSGFN